MAHEEQLEDGVETGISRRKLIATGATLAVAGAAVGAAVPLAVSAFDGHSSAAADQDVPALEEPVMVHLKDARSGQLDIFMGERRASITDRGIAAQLARAAATAS
jgi:hypothetical protein